MQKNSLNGLALSSSSTYFSVTQFWRIASSFTILAKKQRSSPCATHTPSVEPSMPCSMIAFDFSTRTFTLVLDEARLLRLLDALPWHEVQLRHQVAPVADAQQCQREGVRTHVELRLQLLVEQDRRPHPRTKSSTSAWLNSSMNTLSGKPSSVMRPLSRSRTCTSRHSHNHLTLPVRALLADDRQTEDGGDSVFFVARGCPEGFLA